MTAPPSKVINVFEAIKTAPMTGTGTGGGVAEIDLASPFRLERISIRFYHISAKATYVNEGFSKEGAGQVCYVVGGSGILSVGPSSTTATAPGVEANANVAASGLEGVRIEDVGALSGGSGADGTSISVNQDDCFSLPAVNKWQISTEGVLGGCSILVISDIPGAVAGNSESKDIKVANATGTSTLPKIVHAPEAGKWFTSTRRVVKGFEHVYITRLVDSTDLGTISSTSDNDKNKKKNQINNRWGFNRERCPPGTQTSYAHSHSHEDELVFILSGNTRYWHHGETPERVLKRGDCVGWKAGPDGDAICHSLLNDALDENGAGEEIVMLVWGEDKPDEDMCWYGRADIGAHQPWWKPELGWKGATKYPLLGDASVAPRFPRPDDRPFPE